MGTSTRIFRIKPMTASVVFQFKLLDLGQAYNWSLVSFPFTQFFIHTYKYSRRFRLTNGVALICAASRDSRASRGLLRHQISSRTRWSLALHSGINFGQQCNSFPRKISKGKRLKQPLSRQVCEKPLDTLMLTEKGKKKVRKWNLETFRKQCLFD